MHGGIERGSTLRVVSRAVGVLAWAEGSLVALHVHDAARSHATVAGDRTGQHAVLLPHRHGGSRVSDPLGRYRGRLVRPAPALEVNHAREAVLRAVRRLVHGEAVARVLVAALPVGERVGWAGVVGWCSGERAPACRRVGLVTRSFRFAGPWRRERFFFRTGTTPLPTFFLRHKGWTGAVWEIEAVGVSST